MLCEFLCRDSPTSYGHFRECDVRIAQKLEIMRGNASEEELDIELVRLLDTAELPINYWDGFSLSASLIGLTVGTVLCFSNMYFGLQTGWVTMGALQSTLLGYGIHKLIVSNYSGEILSR